MDVGGPPVPWVNQGLGEGFVSDVYPMGPLG